MSKQYVYCSPEVIYHIKEDHKQNKKLDYGFRLCIKERKDVWQDAACPAPSVFVLHDHIDSSNFLNFIKTFSLHNI